jgi:alpha-beta hydrolase superfamily lysophospholipase
MAVVEGHIVTEEATFPAPGGVTLHRASVRPADLASVRARLAIVHGYGDHAGRYAEFMAWLAERGVACHAFDLRGHGRSTGSRGYVRKWDDYLDDLRAFLALPELAARGETTAVSEVRVVTAGGSPRSSPPELATLGPPGDAPLFLLGHSHGGLIVAAAGVRGALPPGVAGCILSAPYLVNCLAVPRVKVAAAHVLNAVVPWLRIRSGVSPRMMSGDPQQVEESRRDPLLLRSATPRWFLAHQPVQADTLARAAEFRLPLMVLTGDADPIADPQGATAFHARAGSLDKALVVYPGFKHEPLREQGRQRVFGDVLAWVEGRARR